MKFFDKNSDPHDPYWNTNQPQMLFFFLEMHDSLEHFAARLSQKSSIGKGIGNFESDSKSSNLVISLVDCRLEVWLMPLYSASQILLEVVCFLVFQVIIN